MPTLPALPDERRRLRNSYVQPGVPKCQRVGRELVELHEIELRRFRHNARTKGSNHWK